MVEWALGLVGVLALVILSLHARFSRVNRGLGEIRTALLGYEGSGGLIQRIGNLETQSASVDERINASRHMVANNLAGQMLEMEQRIMNRIDESDRRVHREIDELKERRRG